MLPISLHREGNLGELEFVGATSGNVAAAPAVATLTHDAQGKTTFLAGLEITGAGATGASVVQATITGLKSGTKTLEIAVPAGAAVGIAPLIIAFNPPLPASTAATDIVVTVPSLGAGNTNACVNAHGFKLPLGP